MIVITSTYLKTSQWENKIFTDEVITVQFSSM